MKTTKGVTLIELLVAMSIFGVLLGTAFAFLTSTRGVTTQQGLQSQATLATRLALLRMEELVGQAAYLYPATQTLQAGGKNYILGQNAFALLLAKGTSYCNPEDQASSTYCGVLYTIEARTPFNAILGSNPSTSSSVLVERKFDSGIAWTQHTVPTKTWGSPTSTGILADSVDTEVTSLGASTQLQVGQGGVYDRKETWTYASTTASNALIQSVAPTIGVRYSGKRITKMQETDFLLSHAVPRGTSPNP